MCEIEVVYPEPAHDTGEFLGRWQGPQEVIDEASRIIKKDRNSAYDNPEDNFARIAKCWTAILDEKLACGCEITAGDVARAMVMLKVVRDAHAPKRDNRVDAVGYVLCLERAEPSE